MEYQPLNPTAQYLYANSLLGASLPENKLEPDYAALGEPSKSSEKDKMSRYGYFAHIRLLDPDQNFDMRL